MKPVIPIVIVLLAVMDTAAQEQQPEIPRTLLKLSPLHFLDNTLKAGVEHFNKTHSRSWAFYASGTWYKDKSPDYNLTKKGLGAEVQYRKYISPMRSSVSRRDKPFNQGVYCMGMLQGERYSQRYGVDMFSYDPATGSPTSTAYNSKKHISKGTAGLALGIQRTLWHIIYFDAYIGGGFQVTDISYKAYSWPGSPDQSLQHRILPRFGLQLAVAL